MKREVMNTEVGKMLRDGMIPPSSSPWASPVVLVTKKDGSTQFCIDYRCLNEGTIKDAYLLPRIDDALDSLAGAQWFSTIYLTSGYWQVEMDTRDAPKTAFSTRQGLFNFMVMPFGLCNSPATFERLMELVLQGLQWTECLVYFDDVIIFGQSFEKALANLHHVFDQLANASLKLKPTK
ncbi:PREDICTED: RNA-directed DNA polymerase homolog [Priapulus caudatus]|uniref:RNA-directed DNA polymerase homolog n=1 Tax=Priapulus caudatus TaxID=37621 RepID=A0ABM1DSG4_PRICU|nr:PREDICTED: RNA-directed DNA polymerase homolog [Priapulus caudatus]